MMMDVYRRLVALLACAAGLAAAVAAVAALPGVALPGAARAAEARPPARAAALAWALGQVGVHERGTSNCGPEVTRWQRAMGLTVPPCRAWCGAFVHQAYLRAGVRLSARLIDPDRTYADAIAGRRGLRRIAISAIRPGDLVLYRFRDGVLASHVGLARARPRGGRLDTVEGNTGHAVRLKTRGTRFVVLAARVVARP